jgi:pre-mRNA-splicing factor SYF1
MTVRDFTQVFEAFAEFEEAVIGARLEKAGEDDVELDLRMARFEQLLDRRPFLVNEVLLRQNPHNVLEWMKRVQLFTDSPGDDKFGKVPNMRT